MPWISSSDIDPAPDRGLAPTYGLLVAARAVWGVFGAVLAPAAGRPHRAPGTDTAPVSPGPLAGRMASPPVDGLEFTGDDSGRPVLAGQVRGMPPDGAVPTMVRATNGVEVDCMRADGDRS